MLCMSNRLCSKDRMYQWALYQHSFEAKIPVFLETEPLSPIVMGQSKSPGTYGLVQEVVIYVK